jgi:hypothetical protein
MVSIGQIIKDLITTSAEVVSLNNLIEKKEVVEHIDENTVVKTHNTRYNKKVDPKKEYKILLDRFIINLNNTDEDDLEDFIAFLTCYLDEKYDDENYFNSTLVLILRKLVDFNNYIDIESIVKLFERVNDNDKIKGNAIVGLINYIDSFYERLVIENMNIIVIVIHSCIIKNNLWISEESYVRLIGLMSKFIDRGLHNNNIIMTSLLMCIDNIIKRYPYFENISVRTEINKLITKCNSVGLVGLDCKFNNMSSNLINIVYDNVITKVHRKSGIDLLNGYNSFVEQLNKGINLIIDGKNIFHDTSASDCKYINIKGLYKYIKGEKIKKYSDREYNHIYIVFYSNHYKVLESHLKDLIESSDHNSIKFCDHLHIILSPVNQNDDILTLHLWLSKPNNYIMTKDNFTDHVKSFHSDQYLYEIWCYYYGSKVVYKY